ncbi:histone deacetylase family protein [Colwellia psychrerythraea]|nr:histone deacetylase [Colwellia psychrerythraea]
MTPLVFHPIYSQLELPIRHRFPIEKYVGIRNALVANGVPNNWFKKPTPVNPDNVKTVYDPTYIHQLINNQLDSKAMRRIGFPWSQQLIERTLTAVGGTIMTAQLALEYGKSLNLTGGYHHAFANFGSGFCMINDLYLAALTMLQNDNISKVLIFDADVHQGDGTAKLASNNQNVFTVSIHGEKNFPHRKQVSNLDFALPKGTTDSLYLETVDNALNKAFSSFKPDAVIYDAGVDIHCNDDLGHLDISTQGVLARDKLVFDYCKLKGIPIAAVIGGGYQRDIEALVNVHLQLFVAAGVIT